MNTTNWTESAACAAADTSLFFPTTATSPAAAISICGGCPVKDACLKAALREEAGHPDVSDRTILRDRQHLNLAPATPHARYSPSARNTAA